MVGQRREQSCLVHAAQSEWERDRKNGFAPSISGPRTLSAPGEAGIGYTININWTGPVDLQHPQILGGKTIDPISTVSEIQSDESPSLTTECACHYVNVKPFLSDLRVCHRRLRRFDKMKGSVQQRWQSCLLRLCRVIFLFPTAYFTVQYTY